MKKLTNDFTWKGPVALTERYLFETYHKLIEKFEKSKTDPYSSDLIQQHADI